MSSNKKIGTAVIRRSLLILTPYKYRNRTQDTKYKPGSMDTSDEVSHIAGHFRNSCMIEFLNILQCSFISFSHKVDSDSLTAETTTSSNSAIENCYN